MFFLQIIKNFAIVIILRDSCSKLTNWKQRHLLDQDWFSWCVFKTTFPSHPIRDIYSYLSHWGFSETIKLLLFDINGIKCMKSFQTELFSGTVEKLRSYKEASQEQLHGSGWLTPLWNLHSQSNQRTKAELLCPYLVRSIPSHAFYD